MLPFGIIVFIIIIILCAKSTRGSTTKPANARSRSTPKSIQSNVNNYIPNDIPSRASQNIRERKIVDFAQKCNQATIELHQVRTVRDYLERWSGICEVLPKLKEIKTNVLISPSIRAFREETIDAADAAIQGENFQWFLRNAIEKEKADALKAIKTTYKNSQTYRQNAFDFFCYDLRSNERFFNAETKEFANQCINEVNYTMNGSTRSVPFHNDAADYQRSLLTPSLRYDILKRDKFRCTICGRGQEDGVKLHVDHIKPVSKGGMTTPENLRTLCQDCNLGKSDRYDDNGYN